MEFLKAKGRYIEEGNKQILLRGFGLGGWFLPEGYMWKLYQKCDRPRRMEAMIERLCGRAYAEDFWQRYLDFYISKKDMEWIAKEGFNSVRLPLNARHLYDVKENVFSLNKNMIARMDELISWCREYKLYVILDMHGAPGGQTGQNIDDSEDDHPRLFTESRYERELVWLWMELVKHYQEEPVVAGYDLLNEPVPNFFCQYNDKVLPLYRKLIKEIRTIDRKHMIILEGLHWASDFSLFHEFTKEEAQDNILLQFHKYWNNPDEESLEPFLNVSNVLNAPLFMGEGGENNCDWYTTAFPLYERLNISWSFWSYKKMENKNSPVTFAVPEGWKELIDWMDGKGDLSRDRAREILDQFLHNIRDSRHNPQVLHALKRELPLRIPCEAYEDAQFASTRIVGAALRLRDPVSILFENGKTGKVDYERMGGEEQPPEENLLVMLLPGDGVKYLFYCRKEEIEVTIRAGGQGSLLLELCDGEKTEVTVNQNQDYHVVISCLPKEQEECKQHQQYTVNQKCGEHQECKEDKEHQKQEENNQYPEEKDNNPQKELWIRGLEGTVLLDYLYLS